MWRRPTSRQARAALWAARAHVLVRRRLRVRTPDKVDLPAPPPLGLERDSTRGVRVALAVTRATCLERSLVLQHWYAANGVAVDVVIGVTPPRSGFRAHAWLEEPGRRNTTVFTEITRVSASPAEENSAEENSAAEKSVQKSGA
jgi:hypothetical protein